MKRNITNMKQEKKIITIELQGEELNDFEQFKKAEFLRSNAEAARKLMLERLDQIKKEAA